MDWLLTPEEIEEAMLNARPGGIIRCHSTQVADLAHRANARAREVAQQVLNDQLIYGIGCVHWTDAGPERVDPHELFVPNRVCISCGSATQPCCGH